MRVPTTDSSWVPSKYTTQFCGPVVQGVAGSEENTNYVVSCLEIILLPQLVNKRYLKTNIIPAGHEIPAFYGNRIFITVFTTARHLCLTFRVIPPYSFTIHFNIIFTSARIFFSVASFLYVSPPKFCKHFFFTPLLVTCRVCFVFLQLIS